MINVLLVDDHPLFLDGLKQFLESTGDFSVTMARSVQDAMQSIAEDPPEIAMLDLSMGDGGGMAILEKLHQDYDVPAIFLTVHIDPEQTIKAMQIGIKGIVLKDSEPEDILAAIETVLKGGTSFQSEVTEEALKFSVTSPTPNTRQEDLLTAREQSIVELACLGLRNRDIAEQCGLTEGTVKAHMHNIFGKLGVSSRAELIVRQGNIKKDE